MSAIKDVVDDDFPSDANDVARFDLLRGLKGDKKKKGFFERRKKKERLSRGVTLYIYRINGKMGAFSKTSIIRRAFLKTFIKRLHFFPSKDDGTKRILRSAAIRAAVEKEGG